MFYALLLFIGLAVLLWLRGRKTAPQALPKRAIVVDGSNVMHWGAEPSAKVLSRVLKALVDKGFSPVAFFDANVGYVLGDHYYGAEELAPLIGVPARQIVVVDKGVTADEALLGYASQHQLRIVTNDKYRDWRVQFPHAAKKGILLGGTWRDGAVIWRGKL